MDILQGSRAEWRLGDALWVQYSRETSPEPTRNQPGTNVLAPAERAVVGRCTSDKVQKVRADESFRCRWLTERDETEITTEWSEVS